MRRHYVDISKIQIFCHKQVFQVLTQKWVARKLNRCFLMEGYHISFFFSSGKMSTEYTWGWTFCSLLFAHCSLLFARLLVAYCEIKLLWTAKKWFGYYETPPQIFCLQISEIFVTFSGWWFSKFSQHAKPFSKLT